MVIASPAAAAAPPGVVVSHCIRGVPLRSSACGARSLPKKSTAQLLNASTRLLPPVIRAAWTPEPRGEGELAVQLDALHLGDGRTAADHRHRPLVEVVEGLRRLALDASEDGLAAAPPLWRATDPSCGCASRPCPSDIRDVADDEEAGKARDGEIGIDVDAAALALGDATRRGDRRGLQPAAPDDAAGPERRPVRQGRMTRSDLGHTGPEP
jgi:hypothetical protein